MKTLAKRNANGHPSNWLSELMNRELFDWNSNNFSNTGTTLPAVNIKENEEGFTVEVAAPGMQKEDFKVEIDNNLLTISSEKQDEKVEQDGEKFTKREFSYQSFQRSFTLPQGMVKEDKIEAKYQDGVLYLMVPKKDEAKKKAPRLIKIS
ncbi:Hsp20/alpha crystallin family protein [Anditalea andensis]|uniref:Heat-shock protein n=1 Tax=Anditalea andensis TaxID=1048983 RepID=A0A074LP82_9BACT|nr:Hsp20/alpha crystallin family protein [Anditalea andensis]KEO75722.1 heat-shock protein [Anditalea andensis]